MQRFSYDIGGMLFVLKLVVLVGGLAAFAHWGGTYVGALTYGAAADTLHASAAEPSVDTPSLVEEALARFEKAGGFSFGEVSSHTQPSIAEYVPKEGRFLAADLVAMQVTLYENGKAVATYGIRTIGDPASEDGLRTGLYVVESKEERYFSPVGKYTLPWRVQFNDRFSLHGEADYAKGSVETGSTPAGITLSDAHARAVYDFLPDGEQLFVLAPSASDAYHALASIELADGSLPATSARAFSVADVSTGETYLEKNADARYPIASITKLVTALTAHEAIGINEEVVAPSGELYIVGDLYYPLFLRSDNGVARSLATHVGTAEFLARMNMRSRAIGMYRTSFSDSSGLSPRNVSSAADLSTLARYLFEKKRFLLDISSEDDMTITSSAGKNWRMTNQNKLAHDPHFLGGKLGYTDEALRTSVALFSVPVDGRSRVVSIVILGSADWKQDTRTLIRWFAENAHGKTLSVAR